MSHSWRSDLYPRTLEKVPLPRALLKNAKRLGKLRESFLDLCKKVNSRLDTLNIFLREVGAEKLRDVCRKKKLAMQWSDGLRDGQEVQIDAPELGSVKVKDNCISLEGGEWLEIADADIMRYLAAALITQHGKQLEKEDFQKILVPPNSKALFGF